MKLGPFRSGVNSYVFFNLFFARGNTYDSPLLFFCAFYFLDLDVGVFKNISSPLKFRSSWKICKHTKFIFKIFFQCHFYYSKVVNLFCAYGS